ncbi:MAG: Ig-like domain-containing protein, partial [Candidatus Njordarchaeota archaeon]
KQYYYYCDADLIGLKFGRTEYQIDTSPPTIVILQPENNTVFYGETEIDFSISVNDNLGIDRIIIYVNGTKRYQFNQVSSFSLPFYQYGTFNVTIEAIDLVGNSNTASVIIHLKESGGGPGPEIDMNLLIAIIAILLIIVIVIIILKRE